MSANEFARRVGKSSAYISMVDRGERLPDGNLKARDAKIWADVLGVTEAELLSIDPNAAQRPRQLTDEELFERFNIQPYDEPLSVDGVVASAGRGKGVPGGVDETMPRRVKGRRNLWQVPIVGDCMVDDILPGELVIYNTKLSPEIGRVMVALRDEEELLIKRLVAVKGRQILRPNRGEDIPVDERIRFLGLGVSVQRPLL